MQVGEARDSSRTVTGCASLLFWRKPTGRREAKTSGKEEDVSERGSLRKGLLS